MGWRPPSETSPNLPSKVTSDDVCPKDWDPNSPHNSSKLQVFADNQVHNPHGLTRMLSLAAILTCRHPAVQCMPARMLRSPYT